MLSANKRYRSMRSIHYDRNDQNVYVKFSGISYYFLSENSKRSDIPRIFKPNDDESSETKETSQPTEFSQSSDSPSSGSGEIRTSSDDHKEAKETAESAAESSGEAVKRNVIPTELFEEGNASNDLH